MIKGKRVLILCTENSCRSQMAEGFLKSFSPDLKVCSAGTNPGNQVHPKTIQVMNEAGIDLSKNYPKDVNEFLNHSFDYIITVCERAKESCPVFTGKAEHRLHIGFDDPAETTGTEKEILAVFRRVRDDIKERFFDFYIKNI